MGTGNGENDEIELLREAVIAVVAMARKTDSDRVKMAMDILLAGTSQLGNRWDEDDVFDEWANPSQPLSSEAEHILGVSNEQLAHCRPTADVYKDFARFVAQQS